jgi:tetratricopeptide (TPR) repeat protein
LALEASPDLWPIWVQYGHMLKESGDKDAASQAYDRALALEPRAADTHLQVGHLRKLQNDLDAAVESYARAHELDPDMADAVRELQALGRADLVNSSGGSRSKVLPRPRLDQGPATVMARDEVFEAKVEALSSQLPKFLYYFSTIKALAFQVADVRSANARHAAEIESLREMIESLRFDPASRDDAASSVPRVNNKRVESVVRPVPDSPLRGEAIAAQPAEAFHQFSVVKSLTHDLEATRGVVAELRQRLGQLEHDLAQRSQGRTGSRAVRRSR